MEMSTPTFDEVCIALRTRMAETVGDRAVILGRADVADASSPDILVIHSVIPGAVVGAELGGRAGLSEARWTYIVTLSVPKVADTVAAEAWDLAQSLSDAFYRADLGGVFCEEPNITAAGIAPDGRFSLSVSVPCWTWTGGLSN